MPRCFLSRNVGPAPSPVALVLFMGVLPALVFAETYLLSRNTLENNGRWASTKRTLEMPIMGAESFMEKPQALARGRLDLSAWYGFQEVLFKQPLDAESVAFDFLLEPNSYLMFICGKDVASFSGIFLGGSAVLPNACIVVETNGRLLRASPLEIEHVRPDRWNHVELTTGREGLIFTLNEQQVGIGPLALNAIHAVGFRGCHRKVLIDNVVIRQPGRGFPVVERFCNRKHWAPVFGALLAAAVLGGALLIGVARALHAEPSHALFSVAALHAVTAITGLMLYGYVLYSQTCYPVGTQDDVLGNIEPMIVARCQEIQARYAPTPPPHAVRILFIGTSQTYGEGALRKEDTMVRVIERGLNAERSGQEKPPPPYFECINAGIRGVHSSVLLYLYEKEWIHLKPQIVVINLSTNDARYRKISIYTDFAGNLERFLALNEARGIQTVFVLEANAAECRPGDLALHGEMRRIGHAHGIPLIELHRYLASKNAEGFLWWDSCHLTSFGQKLAGEYIVEALRPCCERAAKTLESRR